MIVPCAATLLAQAVPAAPHAAGGTGDSIPLAAVLAIATFVPFVLLLGTSFVKISVVLAIVRNAFGSARIPDGLVITGLALVLSIHVMAPTVTAAFDASSADLRVALRNDGDTFDALTRAWDHARGPIQRFLRSNTSERDRTLFLDLARQSRATQPSSAAAIAPAADDLAVLLPAFVVSELTRAFAIGVFLLLPFLVLELVVAQILVALGMQNVSSETVSLPFKLLLFVAADGWYLLVRALVLGYH